LNQNLVLQYCTVWDQGGGRVCSGVSSLQPGTPSKCRCDSISVANVDVRVSNVTVAFLGTSPSCYVSGTNLVQTFQITNPTTVPLYAVTVSDSFSSIFLCCSSFNVSCADADFTVTPPLTVVFPDSFLNCRATKSMTLHGRQSDTITITGQDRRIPTNIKTVTATATAILDESAISITQSVTNAGQWTLSIKNEGSATLTGVTITGAGTSIYSGCSIGDIAPGATKTCTRSTAPLLTRCTDTVSPTVSAVATGTGTCAVQKDTNNTIKYDRECRAVDPTNLCDKPENCDDGVCPVDRFDNSKCKVCSCTVGTCDPTNTRRWSDDCIHKFGSVGATGSTLPASDESKASCSNPSTF